MDGFQVAVIGAGGWGTALANLLADNGHRVTLWARRREFAQQLILARENITYLPGVALAQRVRPTAELDEAIKTARLIVLATPAQALRSVLRRLVSFLPAEPVPIVNTSKGLEENTLARMSQVLTQELPPAWHRQLLFLSGPNFAAEVGQGLPTATVLACADQRVADWVRDFFMCERFRVYTNPDIVGVELGGAIKNVIAMAVGIADGLALGHNTRAALITRGLAEMTRLGVALGANSHTFAGLAGLGDLVLTCTSNLSRNYRAGVALGEGRQLDEILGETQMVVEGVFTTAAARALAERQRVRMPITEELHRVLFEGKPPRAGVKCLMRRHRTGEVDDLSTLAGLSG